MNFDGATPAWPGRGGVYVLLTESICAGPILEVAEACLRGGATALQLREKRLTDDEVTARAGELRSLVRSFGATLVVNDRLAVTRASDADGVHLGTGDLDLETARRELGTEKLLGASCHCEADAARAIAAGADYIGVGPMFATVTKTIERALGPGLLDRLGTVPGARVVPRFAIGGIDASNVRAVVARGVSGIAVCRSVVADADPEARVRDLAAVLDEGPGWGEP